jgi:hypothetical protein
MQITYQTPIKHIFLVCKLIKSAIMQGVLLKYPDAGKRNCSSGKEAMIEKK